MANDGKSVVVLNYDETVLIYGSFLAYHNLLVVRRIPTGVGTCVAYKAQGLEQNLVLDLFLGRGDTEEESQHARSAEWNSP